MKKILQQQFLNTERALFKKFGLSIHYTTFADKESAMEETRSIDMYHCLFKGKNPLWYSCDIMAEDCTWFETAPAAIWYAENISLKNCTVIAPKTFRHSKALQLEHVTFLNASETLWDCEEVGLKNITVQGDSFAMGSSNLTIDGFTLVGDSSFDGVTNLTVRNATLLTRDAFWNCENIKVYDSFISGERLGWNSKNVTFSNCTIESVRGMCNMDNVVLQNCCLLNTRDAFAYSSVTAEIHSSIDSVRNPYSGEISADAIGELIFDDPEIRKSDTRIIVAGQEQSLS